MRKGMSAGSLPGAHRTVQRRREKIRTIAVVVAAAVLGAAAAGVPAVSKAATLPGLTITAPVSEGLFTANPAAFAGTATSAVPIKAVKWSLQNEGTGAWLQPGGSSWSSARAWLSSTLTQPVAGQATWSTSATLGSGQFELWAKAQDTTLAWSAISNVVFASGPAPTAADPGFLTIMFGRSNWVAANRKCVAVPGAPTLLQVGQAMAAMGLTGTGAVVTDTIGPSTEGCGTFSHSNQYPTWSDLDALQALGWSFVSASETYKPKMTTISYANQVAESCGSLTDPASGLFAHGFSDAWGMFAYPDDEFTTAIQQNPVSNCFAFGRTYQTGRNIETGMAAPWLQRTNSVSGGRCDDVTLPCHTMRETGCHGCSPYYTSPTTLEALVNTAGDEWTSLQFYRFLVGAGTDGTLSWDCTSPNWQDHWTSQGEAYCYNDFLAVMAAIPANVHTVGPATVATAWDVNPAVTMAPVPAVSALGTSTGSTAGGTSVTITGTGFTAVAHVAFGSVQATSFVVNSSTQITAVSPPGAGTVDVTVTTVRGLSGTSSADQFAYVAPS
jgi:IPT/TIG domain